MRGFRELSGLEQNALFLWVLMSVLGLALPWFTLREGDHAATSALRGYAGPGWFLALVALVASWVMIGVRKESASASLAGAVAAVVALALPFLARAVLVTDARYSSVTGAGAYATTITGAIWILVNRGLAFFRAQRGSASVDG